MSPELVGPVRERLVKARAIVAAGWTKGAFARTADGRIIGNHCKFAAKFCAEGGVREVGKLYDETHEECIKVLMAALQGMGHPERLVQSWNDDAERTHEEVLALYDRAIASLGEP